MFVLYVRILGKKEELILNLFVFANHIAAMGKNLIVTNKVISISYLDDLL